MSEKTILNFEPCIRELLQSMFNERLVVSVESVSRSGMSRKLKFMHNNTIVTHVIARVLETKLTDDRCIRISGGNMDMIFDTLHRFNKRMYDIVQNTSNSLSNSVTYKDRFYELEIDVVFWGMKMSNYLTSTKEQKKGFYSFWTDPDNYIRF